MNAKEYLKAKGIHPTEPIYWDLENKRISLDELMDEFAEEKVKLCNKPAVSKSEDIECETSCKHSDWIDLYYSSGDIYGRYCIDCGEFFE